MSLLQKRFVGVGRIAFLRAGTIPAPVSRCYKSRFLGAGKGPAPVNEFSGAGQGISRPWKRIFRGGQCPDPPLKMSFLGAACPFSRPWKSFSRGGLWHNPPLEIGSRPTHFSNLFPANFYKFVSRQFLPNLFPTSSLCEFSHIKLARNWGFSDWRCLNITNYKFETKL